MSRVHDEHDYRIAVEALGDAIESITTFKYSRGLDDEARGKAKFLLTRMLDDLRVSEVGVLDDQEIRAFAESITEL